MSSTRNETKGAARALVIVVGAAGVLAARPAPSWAQESGGRWSAGALIGAGVGIASGFALAAATDYDLQEGGAFVVTFLGAAMGATTGYKLVSSRTEPWSSAGRVQVVFPWALGWSPATRDVESAFAVSGYRGRDAHHALAPAVTATLDAFGPIRIGAEVSGIRAVSVGDRSALASLTENVDGRAASILALVGTRPSAERRLTYSVGGGLDRYAVTVETYFDQVRQGDRPDAQQPRRSARTERAGWDAHVRAGIEYHLARDVSLKLDGLRRWKDDVAVPTIELLDAEGAVVTRHQAHSVSMRSFQVALGVGLRF